MFTTIKTKQANTDSFESNLTLSPVYSAPYNIITNSPLPTRLVRNYPSPPASYHPFSPFTGPLFRNPQHQRWLKGGWMKAAGF